MNEFAIKVWNRRTVYFLHFIPEKKHKIKLLRQKSLYYGTITYLINIRPLNLDSVMSR